MPDTVLSDEQITEIEAQLEAASPGGDLSVESMKLMVAFEAGQREHVRALCATVRVLREDLKYRCEALEVLRRCRDRWLTMLNPARADMSVDEAITALRDQLAEVQDELHVADDALENQVALISELRAQLAQVTAERDNAQRDLELARQSLLKMADVVGNRQ